MATIPMSPGVPKVGCETGWPAFTHRAFLRLVQSAYQRGHTRATLGTELAVPVFTFEAWMKPTRAIKPSADAFLQMLFREDLAEDDARAEVMRSLAAEAGVLVFYEVEPDRSDATLQVCEIASALGQLAEQVGVVGEIDARDARELRASVASVIAEAQQLDARLAEIERGGGA